MGRGVLPVPLAGPPPFLHPSLSPPSGSYTSDKVPPPPAEAGLPTSWPPFMPELQSYRVVGLRPHQSCPGLPLVPTGRGKKWLSRERHLS